MHLCYFAINAMLYRNEDFSHPLQQKLLQKVPTVIANRTAGEVMYLTN